MSVPLRRMLGSKISQAIKVGQDEAKLQNGLTTALKLLANKKQNQPEFHLGLRDLRIALQSSTSQPINVDDVVPTILEMNHDKSVISSINFSSSNRILKFSLDIENFVRDTLSNTELVKLIDEPKENIIVEFSSPNIAKPFHFGHLRSTIIGNFISNIFQLYDHNVIRMNYLGDWGTQFGFLKLGMEMANLTDDEVAKNPIRHLFNAYVNANKLAEEDSTFATKARSIFAEMENSPECDLKEWNKYRDYTVQELTAVYRRLNIHFDEYCWESQYARMKIEHILDMMQEKGLLTTEPEGTITTTLESGEKATILKSDGSTLYLTRDIGAIFDRQQKYNFDRIYYVVENGQANHFTALFETARKLGVKNVDGLEHVKFGRISKMSTRKGNVVFLADLLDEAKEIALEIQKKGKNTKIDFDADNGRTADILGVTAIAITDLQRHRLGGYNFHLPKILEEVGVKSKNFQYIHCRLHSLEKGTGVTPATECNPNYLKEPEAIALILILAQLPEVLYKSKAELGSQVIVSYMYSLATAINKAFKTLNIKNEPDVNLQQQRMLLFSTARQTLGKCMKILGLIPLTQM